MVLEFLLLMLEQELSTVGTQNAHELIAITVWQGKSQDAYQTLMGARAIAINYVKPHSSRATLRTGGWVRPPRTVLRDNKGRFIVGGNWRMDWCRCLNNRSVGSKIWLITCTEGEM